MTVIAQSRLRLEPNALALRAIGGWLRGATDLVEGGSGGDVLLARIELAVHEACMNIVDHANLPDGATLDLSLVLDTDRLTVRIVDHGDEFAISEVPTPAAHAPQERGYGVKIIRSIVSDLTYRRIDSTNVLELTINLEDLP